VIRKIDDTKNIIISDESTPTHTVFDFESLGIAYLNDNPKSPVPIKNDMFQSRFQIFDPNNTRNHTRFHFKNFRHGPSWEKKYKIQHSVTYLHKSKSN